MTAVAVLAGSMPPAAAHSELIATDPPAGAELTAAPAQAALTFSESVEPQFATVVLSVAGAAEQEVSSRVEGAVVTADLPDPTSATGAPRPWRVRYRVVSGDGHPITGTVEFTVSSPAAAPSPSVEPGPTSTAPPPAPPAPAEGAPPAAAGEAPVEAPATPASEDAGRSSPPWRWLLASALFMGLLACGAVVLGRRQQRRTRA